MSKSLPMQALAADEGSGMNYTPQTVFPGPKASADAGPQPRAAAFADRNAGGLLPRHNFSTSPVLFPQPSWRQRLLRRLERWVVPGFFTSFGIVYVTFFFFCDIQAWNLASESCSSCLFVLLLAVGVMIL